MTHCKHARQGQGLAWWLSVPDGVVPSSRDGEGPLSGHVLSHMSPSPFSPVGASWLSSGRWKWEQQGRCLPVLGSSCWCGFPTHPCPRRASLESCVGRLAAQGREILDLSHWMAASPAGPQTSHEQGVTSCGCWASETWGWVCCYHRCNLTLVVFILEHPQALQRCVPAPHRLNSFSGNFQETQPVAPAQNPLLDKCCSYTQKGWVTWILGSMGGGNHCFDLDNLYFK